MKRILYLVSIFSVALLMQACFFSSNSDSGNGKSGKTSSKHWTVEKLNHNKAQFIDDLEIRLTDSESGIEIESMEFTDHISDSDGLPQFVCSLKGKEWHYELGEKTAPQPFDIKVIIREQRDGDIDWDTFSMMHKIWRF